MSIDVSPARGKRSHKPLTKSIQDRICEGLATDTVKENKKTRGCFVFNIRQMQPHMLQVITRCSNNSCKKDGSK